MDCRAHNPSAPLPRGFEEEKKLALKMNRYEALKMEFGYESREVYQRAILEAQQKGDSQESSALRQEYKERFGGELLDPRFRNL
jgi:hypothetical protein